jgi:hypothetical protein
LREITTFPSSKYDDQADSTSQALARINRQPPKPGIIDGPGAPDSGQMRVFQVRQEENPEN